MNDYMNILFQLSQQIYMIELLKISLNAFLPAPGFFAVGLTAIGQFAVRKKNLTEPNLTNLISPNLT